MNPFRRVARSKMALVDHLAGWVNRQDDMPGIGAAPRRGALARSVAKRWGFMPASVDRRHVPAIPPLLGMVLASVVGCGGLPADAVRQLEQADVAYRAGQYDRSVAVLNEVIDKYASRPDLAGAYYLRGLCRLKKSDRTRVRTWVRARARQDLKQGLAVGAPPPVQALLHAQLGNLAFEDRRYVSASFHYREATPELPGRSPFDRVAFQYGLCLQRTGRFAEGRAQLERVVRDFAASSAAVDARRNLRWSHDYFTVQCGVYSAIDRARAAAESLRRQGLPAITAEDRRSGANRYVVQVGRHHTYEGARRALERTRRVQPDAFIVP